MLTKNLR